MNVSSLMTYVVVFNQISVHFTADDAILYIISQTKNQALSRWHLF